MSKERIILAFSGGLDTSAIVPWLKDELGYEVIAYCADLGNSPNAKKLKEWAMRLGATEFICEDLRKPFVEDFVFPAVRAGATYQDNYLLGTPLGRPLIAQRLVAVAKQFGATAIAHGCTGKGNDQLRFDQSIAYLMPEATIIAPWRIWPFKGREDLLNYLSSKGFELDTNEKIYSEDINLFHRSCEGGTLENLEADFDQEQVIKWSRVRTSETTKIAIEFAHGLPVAINGGKISSVNLLRSLNTIAGKHGIGVEDIVEERSMGIKSRGVYETPGGTLLHQALRHLKQICWDRQMMNTARTLAAQYGDLLYDGYWHSDTIGAIEAFFENASIHLTGEVTLELKQGHARVVSRKSDSSLYNEQLTSFESDAQNINQLSQNYSTIRCLKQKSMGSRNLVQEMDHEYITNQLQPQPTRSTL